MKDVTALFVAVCVLMGPFMAYGQDARYSSALLERQSQEAAQLTISDARRKVVDLQTKRERAIARCVMTDAHNSADRRCAIAHIKESRAIAELAEAKADLALALTQNK